MCFYELGEGNMHQKQSENKGRGVNFDVQLSVTSKRKPTDLSHRSSQWPCVICKLGI